MTGSRQNGRLQNASGNVLNWSGWPTVWKVLVAVGRLSWVVLVVVMRFSLMITMAMFIAVMGIFFRSPQPIRGGIFNKRLMPGPPRGRVRR